MKILIIQDFLRSGGTERQTVLLANAFAAAGHDVTLLTFRPGGALDATVHAAVKRHALQPFDFHLDWCAPGLARFTARTEPDVILCMGRMANCYARRAQLSRLGPAHGTNVPGSPAAKLVMTMRTGKPLPWNFRRGLQHADTVVANSRDAAATLEQTYAVSPQKISVIHNSLVFPAAATLTRNEALRAQHGATPATTVLLCVAMFRPEKNQRELIEIAAGLPPEADWQLWLAGEGPARTGCETLVRENKLEARVKFLGFQSNPSALYAAADIAVHASWSEALSNFLIEAQAHGLPAVAYQAQGIEECFRPGRTGWAIARDDRAAFRVAVVHCMRASPATRSALAAEAQAYARENFDSARQVQAYLQLFQRLF